MKRLPQESAELFRPGMIVYAAAWDTYYELLSQDGYGTWFGVVLPKNKEGEPAHVVIDQNSLLNYVNIVPHSAVIYEPALQEFTWVVRCIAGIHILDSRTFDEGEG